jgi:hypothetical protein
MRFQQQQKEMTMKPWEREIKELERFFSKTLESENQKANLRTFSGRENKAAEENVQKTHMIQNLKERSK